MSLESEERITAADAAVVRTVRALAGSPIAPSNSTGSRYKLTLRANDAREYAESLAYVLPEPSGPAERRARACTSATLAAAQRRARAEVSRAIDAHADFPLKEAVVCTPAVHKKTADDLLAAAVRKARLDRQRRYKNRK